MASLQMRLADRPQNVSSALRELHEGSVSSFGVGATGPQHLGTGIDLKWQIPLAIFGLMLIAVFANYVYDLLIGR